MIGQPHRLEEGADVRQIQHELIPRDAGEYLFTHLAVRRAAISRSTSSPVLWPKVSLMFLKWAMSIYNRAKRGDITGCRPDRLAKGLH